MDQTIRKNHKTFTAGGAAKLKLSKSAPVPSVADSGSNADGTGVFAPTHRAVSCQTPDCGLPLVLPADKLSQSGVGRGLNRRLYHHNHNF